MAMAGDKRASLGDGERSRKRPFRPEIIEEPQNVSQEAGRTNSSGVSDQRVSISVTIGIPELEQILKQKTFTRSEIQRLTALLHSRVCDDNVVVESDAMIKQLASPQETTIENLPEDVLSKIFIRLLAKQLAQMRCVSKSWNAFLTHHSFVKSHLHRSINTNDQNLLVFYYEASYSDPKPLTAFPCQSPHLELTNFIILSPQSCAIPYGGGHGHRIDVIGSVHGLICSRYDDNDDVIHIGNPSLTALSTLPQSLCSRGRVISFRFGFDPSTNDYKVVKISGLLENHFKANLYSAFFPCDVKEWLQVEIYSMRKGCWKLITERVPSHLSRILNREFVCVDGHDGHIHWLGYSAEKIEPQTIVVFDLGSEKFREMNLPDAILPDNNSNRWNALGVLTGKLCVISWERGDGVCEVWVMDEYGVADSWVKRHTFSPPLGVPAFSGFTSHNEFIYIDTDGCLVLYDPADMAEILEKSFLGRYGVVKVVEYVNSLVWVAPSVR